MTTHDFNIVIFSSLLILTTNTVLALKTVPLVSASNKTTEGAIKSKNIIEFFPDCKTNLTKITWAHAVNSQELLKNALNGTVMMLEADIVLGLLKNGTAQNIPVMAHPPDNSSDLSLQDFLKTVDDFNNNDNNTARKGVKLDFKTIQAFEGSVDIINQLYSKINYPVWLNADILPGPVNSTDLPVDAAKFIKAAKGFANATLSLGWKTVYSNQTNATYTDQHISQMIAVIEQNSITHPITFPVRAGLAAQSLTQLELLIEKVKNSTLTIWNGEGDHVDPEALSQLILKVGVGRVYIDLPGELKEKLSFNSGVRVVKPLALITVLTTFMRLF